MFIFFRKWKRIFVSRKHCEISRILSKTFDDISLNSRFLRVNIVTVARSIVEDSNSSFVKVFIYIYIILSYTKEYLSIFLTLRFLRVNIITIVRSVVRSSNLFSVKSFIYFIFEKLFYYYPLKGELEFLYWKTPLNF